MSIYERTERIIVKSSGFVLYMSNVEVGLYENMVAFCDETVKEIDVL